jgi:hypothetical protein
MTDIDPYPVSELFSRYGKSRDVVYKRLNALKIRPHKLEGNRSYITLEELQLMDALHQHVQAGGEVSDFAVRLSSDSADSFEGEGFSGSNIVRQLSGQNIEQFLELAQAIALMMRPTDHYANYETLERIARNGWLIQSRQLHDLIGIKPKGSAMRWGGFVMERTGRWWRVNKD